MAESATVDTAASKSGYTFSMPRYKVSAKAAFVKIQNSAASSFVDVAPGVYYADAVAGAVREGITAGTGEAQTPPAPMLRS